MCNEKDSHQMKKRKWTELICLIGALTAAGLFLYQQTNLLEPDFWKSIQIMREAREKIREGYVNEAFDDMEDCLYRYDINVVAGTMYTDLAMEYGRYYKLEETVPWLLQDTFWMTSGNRILFYQKEIDRIENTDDKVRELLFEAGAEKEGGSGYAISGMTASRMQQELESLLLDSDYDPARLYYYMAMLTTDSERICSYYEESWRLAPNYLEPPCLAAQIHLIQGEVQEARDLMEAAWQIEKDNDNVLRNLAIIEMLDGNIEAGYEYAKEAYALKPRANRNNVVYCISMIESGRADKMPESAVDIVSDADMADLDFEGYIAGEVSLEEILTQIVTNDR